MLGAVHKLRWLVVWLALLLPGAAGADDDVESAAEMFAAAEKAYQQGDFRAAAEGFEASHELAPHGAALYNAAMAWLAAKERARAADAFAAARKLEGLSDEQNETSLAKLSELRSELGRVAVGGPEGTMVWLEHAEGVPTPALVHVEPGRYEVRAQLPSGEEPSKTVRVAAGGLVTISFAPPEKEPDEPKRPAQPTEGPSALPVVGWVAVGTAVALTGVAIGLGVAALDARDEYNASGFYDRAAYDRADDLRTATNVCWALAGITAATGAVLLVVAYSGNEAEDPAAAAELRLVAGGVRLTGRW